MGERPNSSAAPCGIAARYLSAVQAFTEAYFNVVGRRSTGMAANRGRDLDLGNGSH